jgi:hypothetical protein
MSGSDLNQISRRDFIKGTAAVIGGLIGALIGLPSVAFLLSPAMKSGADASPDAVIALGSLENYPIGVPTRFDFTQIKVNGWSGQLPIMVCMWLEKTKAKCGSFRMFAPT